MSPSVKGFRAEYYKGVMRTEHVVTGDKKLHGLQSISRRRQYRLYTSKVTVACLHLFCMERERDSVLYCQENPFEERVRNSIESSVRRRLMGTKKLRKEVGTESQKKLLVSRGIIELREF